MAVTFSAVAPGASGATGGTSPLTWNHTCTAGDTILLVGVTLDASTDTSRVLSVTYNTQPMTSLSLRHTNDAAAGYLQVFYLASPPTGAAYQVAVSESGGTFAGINGGSLSFAGSGSLSAPQTAAGNGTAASLAFTPTMSGNMVAAFAGCGSTVTQTGSFTQRYNTTGGSGSAGAGFCAGATIASTGSTVTASWSNGGDYWAVIAVEIQVGGSIPVPAALAEAAGDASGTTGLSTDLLSGPFHATAAADLGDGAGAWATPDYATGGP